jgi:hypothetical protein
MVEAALASNGMMLMPNIVILLQLVQKQKEETRTQAK